MENEAQINNSKDLNLFKNLILDDVSEVEREFNILIEELKRIKEYKKDPDKIILLPDYVEDDFYFARKEKKFSLIIIELYALVEQAMQSLYKLLNNTRFEKGHLNGNTVILIENALSTKVTIPLSTYHLAILRNSVLHELLDINKGKNDAIKKLNTNRHLSIETKKEYSEIFSKKPKKIVCKMIEDIRGYINSIQLILE